MNTKEADFGRTWKYTLRGSDGTLLATKELSSDEDARIYFIDYIKTEKFIDFSFQIKREDAHIVIL